MNYQKHTVKSIQKLKKQKQHFAVVTAYDFPTAQIIDELDLSEQEQCSADVNSDGIINILDIVLLVNTIIEE